MRLGVDIRCLQDSIRTGVGEYVWQVLRQLGRQEGFALVGLANAAKKIDLPAELGQVMTICRGHIPNKLMNLKLWLKLGLTMDEMLGRYGVKPEVMWLPNPSFSHVSSATPTLLTVHDISFLHYPYFFPHKGRLWYFPAVKALLSHGLPRQSLLAAVSQHTADDLAHFYPQRKNSIRVVPAGLDEIYFASPSAEQRAMVRDKYKLPSSYLLAVGTVEPRKNYAMLLEAYNMLCSAEPEFPHDLVIAGGWGWRYGSIKHLLQKLSVRSRIHFLGYVSQSDKPAIYAESRLFVYPSLYEGIGLPVLEAMAAGKAVIASHSSSLPEVVGKAGLLVSPWRPELWAEAISWLASNDVARTKLAEQARDKAKQYNWGKTAAVYRALFDELASL